MGVSEGGDSASIVREVGEWVSGRGDCVSIVREEEGEWVNGGGDSGNYRKEVDEWE